ncbi:MAG: tetratricopeptide repeat protein [Chthonomonadales bacterium]
MEHQPEQPRIGPDHSAASSPGETDGLFCPHCGVRNLRGARFCMQCGQRLPASPPLPEGTVSTPPEIVDEEISALLAQAFRKHAAGDTDAAVALCLQVLKLNPNSSSAHSLLGVLYEQRGERDLAIQEFTKVLELNPGSIADRAKLDELREGSASAPPPKINWSRRIAAPVLTENPAAAAIYAITVFFLVFLVGGLAVWYRNYQKGPKPAAPAMSTAQAPGVSPPMTPSPAQSATPQPVTPPSATPFGYPQTYGMAPGVSTMAPQSSASQQPVARPSSTELLAPAPVQPPPASGTRRDASSVQNSNTVHLPDVDTSSQQTTSNPQPANPAASPQPPPPNPGRIQIVVAPSGGRAASGTSSGSTMASQVHEAAALEAQKRGDYRAAVVEYLKALDHSGDRSAYLHQLIGLCYQRLGQNESAVAHYNDAIADYKRLLAAGKNVDAANRGIKACEEGIKACQ